MRKMKKFFAAMLCASMVIGMAACGGKGDSNPTPTPVPGNQNNQQQNTPVPNKNDGSNKNNSAANNEITIGSWWVQYYDSKNESMDVNPDWTNAQEKPGDNEDTKASKAINRQIAQLKWDNVKKIEEKYGVKFWWENLTYAGVQDSINTSILAGSPDCDIYLVDAGMAVPAQVNGLALDLRTILPADHDIFTTQKIASFYDLGDGKACIFYKVAAEELVASTYPLGFNIQMLEDNNLEDPRDLYERGEWTWDKFIDYCQVLTQDTDGDGQVDQYGYCGYQVETFEQLMMSNGASIAMGTKEGLSSAAVGQAIQMMSDMYNTYNICYPYDFDGDPSNSMRNQYCEGNIGFFPIACWICNGNGNYSEGSENLPFDIAFVRWPVGPSGNKDTNAGKNDIPSGAFIIPAGVAEPEKVFNVLYSFWDWNDGDTSLRDNKAALNWWYTETAREEELQNRNFSVMEDCGAHTTFDLWSSLGVNYDLLSIINGTMTAAQFQETYKQQVQDGIDAYFGN